jgi:hypothetical protein
MANGNGNTTSGTDRLGEILGAYFVAVEEGRAPSRQDLLAQHPDLASELAEYFAQRKHNLRRTGFSSRSSFLLIERWSETCVMITGSQQLHGRPTR